MDSTEKGLTIIYTGEGKGKTTAALGLVLRAVGYKKRCLIIQFGKIWFTGELAGVKKLEPYAKLIQGGKGFVKILGDRLPVKEHKKAAQDSYNILYKEVISGNWDVIVADEIIGTVKLKLLTSTQIAKLIKDKPRGVDLVLTGHDLPKGLIKLADLVTEMVNIKHPYQKGILAKQAIDF